MSILWGSEQKTCRECGMKIPYRADKCPYCHTKQTNNLRNDVEGFGCLGLPVVLVVLLLLFALIGAVL